MGSLYNITSELFNLLENGFSSEFVDEETGEIDEEKVAKRINELNLNLDEKVDNIACYIKNTRALAEQIKAEKNVLAERQKRLENRAERLEEYLLACLTSAEIKKVETARNYVKYTTSYPLKVFDETAIPEEYIKTTVIKKPDAMTIKAAIKGGAVVPGVEIETKFNLQIK